MEISILLLYILVILTGNSLRLAGNHCDLKYPCTNVSNFDSILSSTNLLCFKTPFCKITGRESTCNGFYHSNQHLVTVENVKIKQIKKSLWTQVTLSSSHLRSLKEGDLTSSRKLKLDDINIQYSFKKDVLYLITNLKCFFFYNISIHESHPNEICDKGQSAICYTNSTTKNHHLTLPCDRRHFKSCQMYCIHVVLHPFKSCSSVYPKNLIEITFMKKAAEDYSDDSIQPICKFWNADVHVTNVSLVPSTSIIQFTPEPEFRQCFHFYEVYLYRLRKPICDSSQRTQIRKFHVTNLKNESGEAMFSNLTNGYYCAVIVPLHGHKQYEEWSVHSEIFEVHAMKTKSNSVIGPGSFPAEVIIAALLIFCICALGFLFYSIQKRRRKKTYIIDIKNSKETRPLTLGSIKVYIFHLWTEIIKENVRLLKNYLEEYATFEVITMQEISNMARKDKKGDWIKDLFDYKCSKCATNVLHGDGDSSKRFLFINSEQISTKKNINEDGVFLNALNFALTISGKCKDCCHMFVASFGDGPRRGGVVPATFVPGVHYRITKDLVDLCLIMDCTLTRKDLDNSLKNHPLQCVNRKA